MSHNFIAIGETIHASIPRIHKVMAQINELGADGYTKDSEPLEIMKQIIRSQADDGASYIAINMDAFGEDNPHLISDMMVEYVRLVKKFGKGVPACFDSSNDDALIAGLKEWYSGEEVKQPLVNSIKTYTADKMMPLKKEFDFSFIGLLVSEEKAARPGGSHSIDELYGLAEELFDKAMGFGFKPEEIFFDSTVFPLAIDIPMQPDVQGYTYRAFETIRKIKNTPKFNGVHFSMGISNCCRDLPGRKIGICRAYVQKAMEYGLDAGIVNPAHQLGQKPADPELVQLVNAYAKLDGSMEKTNDAMMLMTQFCQSVK